MKFSFNLDPRRPEHSINIDVSDEWIKSRKDQKISLGSLMESPSEYVSDDLPYGCHVIYGGPGSGKSLLASQIMTLGIERYVLFEHVKGVDDSEVGLDVLDMTNFISVCLQDGSGIIDSMRLLSFMSSWPAIMQGVSSFQFAFTQWLSLVASRCKCHLFLVMSTENSSEAILSLYQTYLKGGPMSCWEMRSLGNGLVHRRDKTRFEMQPFTLKNKGDWYEKEAELVGSEIDSDIINKHLRRR